MEKKFRKNWYLGFFGFFALYGINGIVQQEWGLTIWFVWAVWFIFFIPEKQNPKPNNYIDSLDKNITN